MGQCIGGLKQSAAIRQSSERIGQGAHALFQFLSLLRHGQHEKGKGHTKRERDDEDEREPTTGINVSDLADRLAANQRQPRELANRRENEKDDRRFTRNQPLICSTLELAGDGKIVETDDGRHEKEPRIEVLDQTGMHNAEKRKRACEQQWPRKPAILEFPRRLPFQRLRRGASWQARSLRDQQRPAEVTAAMRMPTA